MVHPLFDWQTTEKQKRAAIHILKHEIMLNPKMKHRLILRAIKTEGNPEIRKLIRWYNKKGLL
ncbi:MAG: hypothetical protein AAF843_12855 [Bacteroidota bacterium]